MGVTEKQADALMKISPHIGKNKRREAIRAFKLQRKSEKKKQRKKRQAAEARGEKVEPKGVPRTLENTREVDETMVEPTDTEVLADENTDEFSPFFNSNIPPKILMTTSYKPTHRHLRFINDLKGVFTNAQYYHRGTFELKQIVKFANNRGFTEIIVTHADKNYINGLIHMHLPNGPTAHYKLTSVQLCKEIEDHGVKTSHRPEIVLNNFNTRLGHTLGRMLACLFNRKPEFYGRQVATFHNQRDFIFFRHHRYIIEASRHYKDEKGMPEPIAEIQELGPRFSLKLRSLQLGTFDTVSGEYLWVYKKDNETSRKRFFL
eukprot:TRINITY_DN15766_c0_g1_i1.p1 TRINITY_DN15766_c0_g1~~TRINITY_DN15766_c0_g1_i1.p1  ORF type:complete len:330 (-),score=42.14 TRINITY_DN15766_c0_g1_i1:37-990(-)